MRLNAREAVVKIDTGGRRLPITMPASGLRLKCVACFRLRESQVPQRCANFYVTEFTRRLPALFFEVVSRHHTVEITSTKKGTRRVGAGMDNGKYSIRRTTFQSPQRTAGQLSGASAIVDDAKMLKGFRVPSGVGKPSCRNPRSAFSSYGVLCIGSSGGPPIAAAFVRPGGPKLVFASVIAEIFLVLGSAFARLKAVAIRTGAGPPVGRLCFEQTI